MSDTPVIGVRITAFQRNAFQKNAFQIGSNGAEYFLLRPHQLLGNYVEQWTTVLDGVDTPADWTPTMQVDPLNAEAVAKFWEAGPRVQPQEIGWDLQTWVQTTSRRPNVWYKPTTYWYQQYPGVWKLTGLGASLDAVRIAPAGQLYPSFMFNDRRDSMYLPAMV